MKRDGLRAGAYATGHLQAELIEIDENLCRSELTAAQRSKAVKRRREIWEALHPVDPGGKTVSTRSKGGKFGPGNDGGGKGFAADTAAAAGTSKQSINQHLARADAIGEDDLLRIVGTSLDKGVELDALAKLTADKRKRRGLRFARMTDTKKAGCLRRLHPCFSVFFPYCQQKST